MNKIRLFFFGLFLAILPSLSFGGATSSPPAWVHSGSANVTGPVTVFVLTVPLLSSGSPSDIATIVLPSGLAAWGFATDQFNGFSYVVSRGTTLPASSTAVQVFTGAGGTGSGFSIEGALGNGAISALLPLGSNIAVYTAQTLFVRQTANCTGAGNTVSVYLQIWPAN